MTKLFPPMPSKKQTFGLVPIPKNFTSPNPFKKKPPLERGGITSSSPLHPKKPFWKRNDFNPSSSSFKSSLTIYNSFNVIELSTPYTHWNPRIKKKTCERKKNIKYLNPFAFLKFSPINPNISPPNFTNKLCFPHACLLKPKIIHPCLLS